MSYRALLACVSTLLLTLLAGSGSNATVFTTFDGDLSGFNAAIAGQDARTIDFEELAAYTLVSNQYAASGVTFSAFEVPDWGHEDTHYRFLQVREGPGSILISDPVDSKGVVVPYHDSYLSQFTATFAQPVQFLGGYFIDNRSTITVEVFGGSGAIASISPTGEDGASAKWWGIAADDRVITEAVFTIGLHTDGFGFDNFVFQVPEPGSLVLAFLGVSTLYLSRAVRRRV